MTLFLRSQLSTLLLKSAAPRTPIRSFRHSSTMSSNNNIQHFIAANEQYAATFDKGDLPVPPSKQLLIGACFVPSSACGVI